MSKKKRKAPPGMPDKMAKALNMKRPGAPRKNPIPARERNALQYILERGANGQGAILGRDQVLQLSGAFIDQRNWTQELVRQLAEVEAELTLAAELWDASDMAHEYSTEDLQSLAAFEELRDLLDPPEEDDDEDA